MQLVSSRIWTRVAVSISYDDNHYTTGTHGDTINDEIINTTINFRYFIVLRNLSRIRNFILYLNNRGIFQSQIPFPLFIGNEILDLKRPDAYNELEEKDE